MDMRILLRINFAAMTLIIVNLMAWRFIKFESNVSHTELNTDPDPLLVDGEYELHPNEYENEYSEQMSVRDRGTDAIDMLDASAVSEYHVSARNLKKAKYVISAKEKRMITGLLNNQRRNSKPVAVSMKQMSWNLELERTLQNYIDQLPDRKVLFAPDIRFPQPCPGYNRNFLLCHITETQELAMLHSLRCRYFLHDTFDSRKKAVYNIFKFRKKQKRDCYRYAKCDKNVYAHFTTCNRIAKTSPGDRCAGAGRFYGNFLNQVQGIYACVPLGIPGPSTPSPEKQDNSFVCITCDEDIDWIQTNDVPFTTGRARASQCLIYSNYSKPLNGLCTNPDIGKPQSKNTAAPQP